MGPTSQRTLPRDRLTWLIYLQIGSFAGFAFVIGPVVPLLASELAVPRSVAGLHGTAMAVGFISAGLVAPWIAARWGKRVALWGGLAGFNVGLVVFTSVPHVAGTLAGAMLANFSGVVVLTIAAAALYQHHGGAGPAAVSEAHALAATVGIGASFLLSLSLQAGMGWRPVLVLPLLCTLLLALTLGGTRTPEAANQTAPPPAKYPCEQRFFLSLAVHIACLMIEFSLVFWVVDLLVERTAVSPGTASLGLTTVLFGIAAGRVLGARLALYWNPDWLLLAALATSATGTLVFWLSSTPEIAFTALLVTGGGIALHSPLSIVRVINSFHGSPEQASGHATTAGGIALAFGPLALGVLADITSPHDSFLLVPAFHLIATTAICASHRSDTQTATRLGSAMLTDS